MVYTVNVFCLAVYIYYMYKLYSYRDPQRKYVHVNTLYQILVNTFNICFNGNWQQNKILLKRQDGFDLL